MKNLFVSLFILFSYGFLESASPVPYSGKVAISGVNYHGEANFTFSLYDGNGATVWQNGQTPNSTIQVRVHNGRYSVLLGGQGMNALSPQLFLDYDELFLKVHFDNGDGNGLRHLTPDQPITATPRALVAEVAKVAKSVKAGGVTGSQIKSNTITTAQLNEQILKYLKPEITHQPKVVGVALEGQSVTLKAQAEGKYLTYQWYKNDQPIPGAVKNRYVINDANKSLNDGNYSLLVSNEIGSIRSGYLRLEVGKHIIDLNATVAMDMIWCPPGIFTMGSPNTEAGRGGDETPHQVTLTHGFFLGKYEVTQTQYEAVMMGNPEGLNTKPSRWLNNNDRPVEKVSWNDIQVFLSRVNDMEQTAGRLPVGWKYVLPTEAQWEYACRAGTTTAYSWGNEINSSLANYNRNMNQTVSVGQYAPNLWGFFDMHGNVWEWTADWFNPTHPTGNSVINPAGPASGLFRVLRGGSWLHDGSIMRSAKRSSNKPVNRSFYLGFRLAFQAIPTDTANPELELFGGDAITREAGQAWAEPGVEAHDVRDGNITDQIVVTGTVDMNSTGTYLLTYTVQDGGGNTATTTRTVTVVGNRTVDLNATVAMDMIWCSPGTFTMGSPTTEAGRGTNETEHNVSLTHGFYLGKYEVTQAQYEAVMTGNTETNSTGHVITATPSNWHGNPDRPVEMVSWEDAQVFLSRLNEQQASNLPAGWSYVLPTESQWEYACRAGTTTAYSWGNDINGTQANYRSGNELSATRDVGQYEANSWGFFDMHGNVWEWTADWYIATYPTGNPVIDPTGPASGSKRVLRSGSRYDYGTTLRSAKRLSHNTSMHHRNIGFRISLQKSL